MRIAFITTDWADAEIKEPKKEYGGVGYYRCIKPAKFLKKLGHEVDVYGSNFNDIIDPQDPITGYNEFCSKYDVVITKVIDNRLASMHLVSACKNSGTPLVVDIDDNFLEVHDWQPASQMGYQEGGDKRAYATAYVSFADALFVSTEPLKTYFQKLLKEKFNEEPKIFVLPNSVDPDDWSFQSPKNVNKTVIGWHGSVTHDEDLLSIFKEIEQIMVENPSVELEIMGGIKKDKVRDFFKNWNKKVLDRVRLVGGTQKWYGFPKLLMKQVWDIGICPLIDSEFNRAKSHIKWLEMSIKGIPVIASNVQPYSDNIKHRKTGLIAKDPKEFGKHLRELIKDKELRKELAQNAKNDIENKHLYKKNIKLWEKAIKEII